MRGSASGRTTTSGSGTQTFAENGSAEQFVFVLAKKVLGKAVDRGDGNLALKLLDRRQRDRYHTKLEQEVRQTTVEEVLDEVEEQTEYYLGKKVNQHLLLGLSSGGVVS